MFGELVFLVIATSAEINLWPKTSRKRLHDVVSSSKRASVWNRFRFWSVSDWVWFGRQCAATFCIVILQLWSRLTHSSLMTVACKQVTGAALNKLKCYIWNKIPGYFIRWITTCHYMSVVGLDSTVHLIAAWLILAAAYLSWCSQQLFMQLWLPI